MHKAKATGAAGETYVSEYLLQKGYIIKERNFYSRCGEIDIIAEKNGILAFVEVKTRRKTTLYKPQEAVTKAKQEKLIKTAYVYLEQTKTQLQPRFDIAEVFFDPLLEKPVDIHYIKHAFWQEADYAVF